VKLETLSKSRFKLALTCPTKVFYSLDPRYANENVEDEFMEALAKGGNQVGELAKLMFRAKDPESVEITSLEQEEQIRETAALLRRKNVTIFEGTILHDNLLVRVDVLVKRGSKVELIEVKAKSWMPGEDSLIGQTARANPINPSWEPYVYDIAFQERVLSLACPTFEIRPWLMLVDKSKRNSVPGLALKFIVEGEGRGKRVAVDPDFDVSELTEPLLVQVDAREAVDRAQNNVRSKRNGSDIDFDELIKTVAQAIRSGKKLGPFVGPVCKSCEFYCEPGTRTAKVRSGWAECMESHFGEAVKDPRRASIFGFYGRSDTAGFVEGGRLWIRDLTEGDLNVKRAADKISPTERQALQWREIQEADSEPFLQAGALKAAMSGWRYPLHFIDFETAAPALPFHVGHRPYQPIFFQFSHHVMTATGDVRHATECLVTDGAPSVEVLRQLCAALGSDDGTVLHWYPHERTILSAVREELEEMKSAPKDKTRLLVFLDGLGLDKDDRRRMFDMGRLIADQVFLPGTGGSSSMKKFLPAVLQQSAVIRKRYAKPIYGTPQRPSHNFSQQTWVVEHDGGPIDPYKLLSPLFGEHDLDEALALLERAAGEVVANGAAAMIAYAKLQDPGMSLTAREELRKQLLRYCELDTLAMVMVYEALREWVRS